MRVDPHLVSLLAPRSFQAEQYRTLRHFVEQEHKDAALQVVAITSPGVADGKTTTALNLAGSLAQAPDSRVLLVDADLRQGSVAAQLGLRESDCPGLAAAIVGSGRPLDEVTWRCTEFNLSVVPSGRCAAAPYEALKSPRFGELLAEARQQYDYIVLDTPPSVVVPDFRMIAKWIDGFLLVVAANKTPRRLIEEALDVVSSSRMVALVFNRDDRALSGYSSYYYGTYGAVQSLDGQPAGWRSPLSRLGRLARGRRQRAPGSPRTP